MLTHHNYASLKPGVIDMGAGDQQLPLKARGINKFHSMV